MYLLIDPSEKDRIKLSLFNKEKIIDKECEGQNRELLFYISQFLIDNKIDKNDIQGIVVVVGQGGFTSTRLAVTTANTFAYVSQIPLLAVKKEQISKIQSLIPELTRKPKGQYISATYSGEPNIGG